MLRMLSDVQRGHHKGSILNRRLSRGSSQHRLSLPARGASGEGGRAPLRAHRSSHYRVLLVPPLFLSLPSYSRVLETDPMGAVIFSAPLLFPSPLGRRQHLRGAEMKSNLLVSRRSFRALPQHLDSSSTRKAWRNLELAFIMQSQPFPRGIMFTSAESWRIIRGVYAPLKWV